MPDTAAQSRTARSRHRAPVVTTLRVAYQGIPGAFGEEAVRTRFGGEATPVGLPTFAAVLGDLLEGRVDRAVIPVHNSCIGAIVPACTALDAQRGRIRIIDKLELSVRHCLAVLPGVRLNDVRVVASHPAALAQCRVWTGKLEFLVREVADTATAARDLSRAPRAEGALPVPWYAASGFEARHCGAIASGAAARRYGLRVLAEGVQDLPDNYTRFAVVAVE